MHNANKKLKKHKIRATFAVLTEYY